MGFLNNFFGNTNEGEAQSAMNWVQLTNLTQLEDIVGLSNEKPIAIFKHSTRCSISRMALKQFEREFDSADKITPYFLDLLLHRDISNEIASRFGVIHQSPQLIVIKEGKSVYDASHSDIQADDLKQFA
jgi:bacillithiol system protein YtxJ